MKYRAYSGFSSNRKEKPLPLISEDEIPFDIPEGWEWVQLKEITSEIGDGIHGTPEFDPLGEYYFINGNNLNNGKIELKDDTQKVSEEEYRKYKKPLSKLFISLNFSSANVIALLLGLAL